MSGEGLGCQKTSPLRPAWSKLGLKSEDERRTFGQEQRKASSATWCGLKGAAKGSLGLPKDLLPRTWFLSSCWDSWLNVLAVSILRLRREANPRASVGVGLQMGLQRKERATRRYTRYMPAPHPLLPSELFFWV